MAKQIHKLTDLSIKRNNRPGWYADGRGLYLQVTKNGSKSWAYRYEKQGKERWHGMGAYPALSLAEARGEADNCRHIRLKGFDPIDYKKVLKTEQAKQSSNALTFKECALAYIESHQAGWKNKKHAAQWRNTMETYAYPEVGEILVASVDIHHIMRILESIWFSKTETASRVRQRIENILDWAKVRGYRDGENPARWKGHLDKLLPQRTKVQKVKHFPAMPYQNVPAYFQQLRQNNSLSAKALAFIILTATRSGEARGALNHEISLKNKTWEIPPERMKAERAHRIPLTKEAISIIKESQIIGRHDYLFFGQGQKNKFISGTSISNLLKTDHPTLTIHGFRSSFRDWCAEQTNFSREVAEAALAHVIKDKTEAAYQRGDLFDKRRKLMTAWATYCAGG